VRIRIPTVTYMVHGTRRVSKGNRLRKLCLKSIIVPLTTIVLTQFRPSDAGFDDQVNYQHVNVRPVAVALLAFNV